MDQDKGPGYNKAETIKPLSGESLVYPQRPLKCPTPHRKTLFTCSHRSTITEEKKATKAIMEAVGLVPDWHGLWSRASSRHETTTSFWRTLHSVGMCLERDRLTGEGRQLTARSSWTTRTGAHCLFSAASSPHSAFIPRQPHRPTPFSVVFPGSPLALTT